MAKYLQKMLLFLKYTYLPLTHSLYDLLIHSLANFAIPIRWKKNCNDTRATKQKLN